MSKLACLGGKAVTNDLLGGASLARRRDLERKYLLKAYETGIWDQQHPDSMVGKCEQDWAGFNDARFCAMVTNGTHALQLALEALEIGVGDEVIVPGLTFYATASAVIDVNAIPVLVDIAPETLCIDTRLIEAAITPRTRAIIPVHLYNRMADMDKLMRIVRRHKLRVIEDTAHAHGSRWGGRAAGTLGDLGCFSFQMSKLVTGGEGGGILCKKKEHYLRILSMRLCGRTIPPGVKVHSGNFRLSAFQAAVIRGQIAALRRNAELMDRNSQALDHAVAEAPGVKPLRRSRRLTRQCGYCFVFRYDKAAFDGLDANIFRKALSAELSLSFGSTYTPMTHVEAFFPHTKRRHRLSRAYVKAITPSRWKLPVVETVWRHEAVVTGWRIFACPPKRARYLSDAIAKIYEHREELLGAARRMEGKR